MALLQHIKKNLRQGHGSPIKGQQRSGDRRQQGDRPCHRRTVCGRRRQRCDLRAQPLPGRWRRKVDCDHRRKGVGQGDRRRRSRSAEAMVEDAAAELGGIDTIVCNVSALAVGNTPETRENLFRVEMMHTVNSVAAALPFLEKSGSASIVIVASVSGFEIDFAAGSYGAFKAALIHYSKGLSNQLIAKGIRVNVVSPGNTYFEGGIWHNIERGVPELYKTAMSLNPTGRMGTAQEVAAGVVFLASPVASRVSGTNLIIDGALTKAV